MNSRTVKHMRTLISADGRIHETCEVDRDGNPIGPPRVATAEPETIANGLSAVPERVSRFVVSATPKSTLLIFALDRTRGCALARFSGPTTISLPCADWSQHVERERGIRDLFARNGIAQLRDARGESERFLRYPLPESAERIAFLCSEVLGSWYGIADDEALLFTVMRYP